MSANSGRVDFRLFSLGRSDEASKSSIVTPEGTIILQRVGFPRDFDDCTCIPKGPVGAWAQALGSVPIEAQWYKPAQTIARIDIPADLSESPMLKGYICHLRYPDTNVYPITSIFVDGQEIQWVGFVGKIAVFKRLGYVVEIDLSEVSDDQTFTLSAEWTSDYIELRVTWLEGPGADTCCSGWGITELKDMDAYRPSQKALVVRHTCRFDVRKNSREVSSIAKPVMDEQYFKVKSLTVEGLIGCLQMLMSKFPEADSTFLLNGMAYHYMRYFVGDDWFKQVAIGTHSNVSRQNRPGRQFLRAESETQGDGFRHQERCISIAEHLFNLKEVEGIDDRIASLAEGQIESTYAELQAGGFLAERGLNFRFVTPTGTTGLDYDAEIYLSDGQKVNCEMKCKIEVSPLSKNGILTRLNDARKQLPKGEHAIIFLKIPESWILAEAIAIVLHDALVDFFRQTKRIVAVVVCWEEVKIDFNSPGGTIIYRFRIERNMWLPDLPKSMVETLDTLTLAYGQFEPRWISFSSLVERFGQP